MSTNLFNLQPLRDFMEENECNTIWSETNNKKKLPRLAMIFPGNITKNWFVIIDTYSHKTFGRGKREYLKEFSEKERKTISHYHTLLYNWYMRTGTPNEIELNMETYELMNRAANFFATI